MFVSFSSGRGVSTQRKTAISRCLADTSSVAVGRRVHTKRMRQLRRMSRTGSRMGRRV